MIKILKKQNKVNCQLSIVNCKRSEGQSLAEVVTALGVLSVSVATIGLLFISSFTSFRQGVERTQATFLAREGLGAVRSIRDADFDNLTAGTHGIALVSNQWTLSGNSDTQDQFTRTITITDIDIDIKKIESAITWQFTPARQGSIVLTDYLTDWNQTQGDAGEDFTLNIYDAYIDGKELRNIIVENTGTSAIIIDKMVFYWTNSSRKIEEILMGGVKVWAQDGPGSPTGSQYSGTEIDIQDYTLGVGSGVIALDRITFNNDMDDNNFLVKLIMTDSSTKFALIDYSGGDASDLVVDWSQAYISGKELRDITLKNTGPLFLNIDKITPSWTVGGSTKKIENLIIGGVKVWSKDGPGTPTGAQNSGTELDISNYQINPGVQTTIQKFEFDNDIVGATFDITFTMGNGTASSTGYFSP